MEPRLDRVHSLRLVDMPRIDRRTDRTNYPVRLAGTDLGKRAHICGFFNTPDEQYAVLLPFIQEALELGEKAIHTVDPRRRQEHLGRNSSFAQFRVHTAWTAAYATRRISSGGSALRWTTVSETVVAVSRALRDVKLLRQAAVLRTRAFLRLVRSKANKKPLQPASPLP